MQEELFPQIAETIYTVTDLTREIKSILETQYPSVWVTGEISNFRPHSSGHFYFTLKDENSQITAVMFRNANRNLKFKLEDGLEVIASGRISVYELRGNYQLILEYLEPKGLGALQLAFTQLKKKLEAEGLFAAERKRPLPFCPKKIGIITSLTGAVIRDMIRVLHRRNRYVDILLFPVNVQGETAAPEIAAAIEKMNELAEVELLIVGRGGGSLEDLWAFNTEMVARAISHSNIPIISAVGHETDVTIADFVADLRAPTPSAAAELAVPVVEELIATVKERQKQLFREMLTALENRKTTLKFWISHLKHPKKRLEELSIHLDDLVTQLRLRVESSLKEKRSQLTLLSEKLEVLSPLSILSRGYSIVRKTEGTIIKDSSQVKPEEQIHIRLRKGSLLSKVIKTIDDEKCLT